MARLAGAIRHFISERGIDPSCMAGYQVAALGALDEATLTVWTNGTNRAGQPVVQQHDFPLQDFRALVDLGNALPAPEPRQMVQRQAQGHDWPPRRAVAVGRAMRHSLA